MDTNALTEQNFGRGNLQNHFFEQEQKLTPGTVFFPRFISKGGEYLLLMAITGQPAGSQHPRKLCGIPPIQSVDPSYK